MRASNERAEETAWAAGYFDGDGTFSLAAGYAAVSIGSTDPELLWRFQGAVSAGNVIGPFHRPHPQRWSKKPQYFFQAYRAARSIAEQLWPFLGTAKRVQAARLERSHTWNRLPPLGSEDDEHIEMDERSRVGLAWAAGFFDAEGCFSFNPRTGPGVSITNTDRSELNRFRLAVGIGKIYGPYHSKATDGFPRKPHYFYKASGFQNTQAIAAMLWFKLGSAKKAQARVVLAHVSTTCRRGHPKTPGHKGCRECTRLYWKARREAKRNTTAEPTPEYLIA